MAAPGGRPDLTAKPAPKFHETSFSDPLTSGGEPEGGEGGGVAGLSVSDVVLNVATAVPRVIHNGLVLKRKSQENPFMSFSYALGPRLERATPIDWKILVTDDVQSQNIHCHELQGGDSLAKLITHCRQNYSNALILVNTRSDYVIEERFLKGMEEERYPVIVLTQADGVRLLDVLEQRVEQDNVQAKIEVESAVDVSTEVTPLASKPPNASPVEVKKEQGVGEKIKKTLFGDTKRPSVDLKAEMRKLIFPSGEPIVVSEDGGRFQIVMSYFQQYEKLAKTDLNHGDIGETLRRFQKHFGTSFQKDFPFYILLGYRMRMKRSMYQCEELTLYITEVINRMESLDPRQVAATLNAFVQRQNFNIQFSLENLTDLSVFHLLELACVEFMKMSNAHRKGIARKDKGMPRRVIYSCMMWITIALKLNSQRGFVSRSTISLWKDQLLKSNSDTIFDTEAVSEFKKGLELGKLLRLSADLVMGSHLILELLVSEHRIQPLQHVRDYVQVVEPYLPEEVEFLTFLTEIRAYYHPWLKGNAPTKLQRISEAGTVTAALDDGLSFLDMLYELLGRRNVDDQLKDSEVTKWLSLLLGLVDITHDSAVIHLRKFLQKRAGVVKKFKPYITKQVIGVTQRSFHVLSIQQFYPLYRSFMIWPNKFLEEYLGYYKVPAMIKICDPTWKEFLGEIYSRFPNAQMHKFLLDFLRSVSQRYAVDKRGEEFIPDLLNLKVQLFSSEGGREEEATTGIQQEFVTFLSHYINRNALKAATLRRMPLILSLISTERDEFQQLILTVVQREIIPEFKSLQGAEAMTNSSLRSVLHMTVNFLALDLSWLTAVTMKQRFCWGFVATCCSKVPISVDSLDWIHTYYYLISQLGTIYSAYCKAQMVSESYQLLTRGIPGIISSSPDEDVHRYMDWVLRMQEVLVYWKTKFAKSLVNFDDVFNYASHQQQMLDLSNAVNAHSCVVSTDSVHTAKITLLEDFEQLNIHLIHYIPGEPEARWCTLPAILVDYGINLPPICVDLISKHVLFPNEEKALAADLLINPFPPNTSGSFQPGLDIALKLTKAIMLKDTADLVRELSAFLTPLREHLDMLVFFKLHNSVIFNKYVQLNLRKEAERRANSQASLTASSRSFLIPSLPGLSPLDETILETGTTLNMLIGALSRTRYMLLKLMEGTAAYREIIAEGDLNLENLDIDAEFVTLTAFSRSFTKPLASCGGLAGVRSMLELFKYTIQIEIIHSVCEQYKLKGCLDDSTLIKLVHLVESLKSEATRDKITPLEAAEQLKEVKEALCLTSQPHSKSLDLFASVANSAIFYQFVRDKKFVGDRGHAHFRQQYQLITAQLQHEEYDETVLNHLYAAFRFIEPFMDTVQDFSQLMSRVVSLDTTHGLKQLETVNANITLIRLWFNRAEGDTLQNVAGELDCILSTGTFVFKMNSDTSSQGVEILLQYSPSTSTQPSYSHSPIQPSSLEDAETVATWSQQIYPRMMTQLESRYDTEDQPSSQASNMEIWSGEQINDFVRKLGFLDTEKEGGDKIKNFLHINEIAHKLLERYMKLKELGNPKYAGSTITQFLLCGTKTEYAEKMVQEADGHVSTWVQWVDERRSEYVWLLFFSVPKVLVLNSFLCAEQPLADLDNIIHELSFLCTNTSEARDAMYEGVKKYLTNIDVNDPAMLVVGHFLSTLFEEHLLPQRSAGGSHRRRSISRSGITTDSNQLLHSCAGYNQKELVRLIVSIYHGVPESFEVFHCRPTSTEEELSLFLKRAQKYPLEYLVLEVNRLPFKLQEYLMQEHLMIQRHVREQREQLKTQSHSPTIHFVETAPSVLREMPWIILREHNECGLSMTFEKARDVCMKKLVNAGDFACIQLVYGHSGDGKTHYIKQCLGDSVESLTIAVNEAFTPLNAIKKLRTLPFAHRGCAIYFNFTMLPPGESVDDIERQRYSELVEVIGWFFFDFFILGYVEDPETGLSFRFPGGLAWSIYIEVPSRDLNMTPSEALEHFRHEIPTLGLVGTPFSIHPDTPYTVDDDVQLVCKYLKAYIGKGLQSINSLYREGGPLIKFSNKKDLPDEECQVLLSKLMPDHVKKSKITQRVFVKYMKRRCGFLDNLPAFNYNSGAGEYISAGKRTDTRQLGSTLMRTMISEVGDFCDPTIKENWSFKPHQQLIYDFCDGEASLGLITLHPDQLPEEDKLSFQKIGVKIPSMADLYSRELLEEFISRALNIRLENKHLEPIDEAQYVLTLDYTIKMLNIHERYMCGIPVIIEGETGVGKTALVEMLSKLWNHALLISWKRERGRLLEFMRRQLGVLSIDSSENYLACVQVVEKVSAGQYVDEQDLLLVCQLPDPNSTSGRFYSILRAQLLDMRTDPVLTLLTQRESKAKIVSLEEMFEHVIDNDTSEATARLLYGVLTAQIRPTFHKINVHAAMTPENIRNELSPVFKQARRLKEAYAKRRRRNLGASVIPFVTVFLDEINTSSCLGIFKEIIVDRSFDGEPIPSNVFIVAACNPHRGNSLASLEKGTWVRSSYYVRQLHPTLHFLMWDYGSLDEHQERDYINAKMRMLNKDLTKAEVATLTELIVTSQQLMRSYSNKQLRSCGFSAYEARISSRSCVSQRDIQRVFTFYQWLMDTYSDFKQHGDRSDYSRRAVLVSLGIVYYMRLGETNRRSYQKYLDEERRLPNEVQFTQAFNQELNWYMALIDLPTGIACTQALKENIFATIICTVTHTPLIIVGAPGSSKTLSFNLVIATLKGHESKNKFFRFTEIFRSLDPQCYQCSRRTTSNEIQTVFSRAINRQRTHFKFSLPIYCVVFMDEAGLPEESHESLKVLHYHLDKQEVSFVAITNHVLDAAKTNRAVSLFRPEASEDDLRTLARGCLCSKPENPPIELKKDLDVIESFCPVYIRLMDCLSFREFFGLRDFIHFVHYLRRRRTQMLTPQLVLEALERNFNGLDNFEEMCSLFLGVVQSDLTEVKRRSVLEILRDSLDDRPQLSGRDLAENEVRYKLIIDPSEDDSLIRLLFSFGVLDRERTKMFVCSDFPGDGQLQKINTIAAIRHSAIEGHTVIMSQTDDIHESFYDLFNQRFRRIDDPQEGPRYYTNIAIGAHLKPCRVHPDFQCIVVVKKSEIKHTPAPFLNRFEKYYISHRSLLDTVLGQMPPCVSIVVQAAMEKVKQFIDHVNGASSLYGLQPDDTLDSLVLTLLPPSSHTFQPLQEPSVIDSDEEVDLFLMKELLQALRHSAGFQIPTLSYDELCLDTQHVVTLVKRDPEFAGLLPTLADKHSNVAAAIAEAMKVLHTAPAPHGSSHHEELSPSGCLVVSLLEQWLIRYLCKRLMQLMTSEAIILHRKKLRSTYIVNYLEFQEHFSLKDLIKKHYDILEASGWDGNKMPTKLLCFTRSSPLLHQLPSQYPSHLYDAETTADHREILQKLAFPEASKLTMCKISSIPSQSSIQKLLRSFIRSPTSQVLLLIANMQEASSSMVNHLRIMIEEVENLSTYQSKFFVLLIHFPPANFFDSCYPSLFLRGWDHYYLDTIAHTDRGQGVVDIGDWFLHCCFPQEASSNGEDSLMQSLEGILPEAIPILLSRVYFGKTGGSFNHNMNGSERSKALNELLFQKGIGQVLCKKFRSYWKPAVMEDYLERAALFAKNRESTLSITDSIQTMFKTLFFDFLVYIISRINEDFNLDVLFGDDCTPHTQRLFLDILHVFPCPRLPELKARSNSLLTLQPLKYAPRFPFFSLIATTVDKLVDEGSKDANEQLDFLNEEVKEEGHHRIPQPQNQPLIVMTLQKAVCSRITDLVQKSPRDILSVTLEAVGSHDDLWQYYFKDFTLRRLHLEPGGELTEQILAAFFGQIHKQDPAQRIVSLHVYIRVYQLNLAKMATILRPLSKLQNVAQSSPSHIGSPECSSPSQQFLSVVQLTHHPLGTPEHLSAFVVCTLFNALIGSSYTAEGLTVSVTMKKLSTWFQAYRDVLVIPTMKLHIYNGLAPDDDSAAMEARLNIMHAVYLCLQTTSRLDEDILLKGEQAFQTLFNRHFSENLKLRSNCPRLNEVTAVLVEVLCETTFSPGLHRDNQLVRLLLEGLLAHFFCADRPSYHLDDARWFLKLANEQLHWQVGYLEQSVIAATFKEDLVSEFEKTRSHTSPLPQGTISMYVFKLYLMRILGQCNQESDEVASRSGPLLLFNDQIRKKVGEVLTATSFGEPGPYIPTFYQKCSPISSKVFRLSENKMMHQSLAHLYFLTVLECLSASQTKLSVLVRSARTMQQMYKSSTTSCGEQVLLMIELQAVVQVAIQQVALHFHPSNKARLGELTPLLDDVNALLDDPSTGGGEAGGHGMVLALHLLRLLKSSRKFSNLLQSKYKSICSAINCLRIFHQKLLESSDPKPYLFPFMLPGGEDGTELSALYQRISRTMLDIHRGLIPPEELVKIAEECTHTVRISSLGPSQHSLGGSGTVDKHLCFRMMVWLTAYYEFFDKKIRSELLGSIVEKELKPFLKETQYIRLIKCFLDPTNLIEAPEAPNPLRDDELVLELEHDGHQRPLKKKGEVSDPLYELFMPKAKQQDQSDVDLRHSIANLTAVVLGCPAASNHLWYHMFGAQELPGTYMTGFMYDSAVKPDGLFYDCGVELSPDGQFGRQDYLRHASRGTYSLHSLYLILWANFAAFSVALLTQPDAARKIHGTVISDWLSVRHYCVSQLRTVWLHMRNNLGISDEERSFLVMRCMKRLYELLNTDAVVPDSLLGLFATRQKLDGYEKMWHTCIYRPCWDELRVKFAQYSQLWHSEVFIDLRRLEKHYPYFPKESDFTHSILSSGDLQQHAEGGDFRLLSQFVMEWPRLQAGGLLLPDLIELYVWLHYALAHLVTMERAATISIGRVFQLAVKGHSREMGEHLNSLYERVKVNYNKYVELIGGAIGAGACAALKQGNRIYTIADDLPLLHFLSDTEDEGEGNDWLYTVIAHIIIAHNAFIEELYSATSAHPNSPLARLLPDEPSTVYPTESNEHHSIVGNFGSLHGINNYLQIVRSRYQPSSDVPVGSPSTSTSSFSPTLQPKMSLSHGLLQTGTSPTFQLAQVQEDIVTLFVSGKPLIHEPSLMRRPFKFKQIQATAQVNITDVATSSLELEEIERNLPEAFKQCMEEALVKRMEYEFHTASYHSLVEVVMAMRTVAGHLTMRLSEESLYDGLEEQTASQFMLTLYEELTKSSEVMEEIGIHSLSSSQLACIVDLPLADIYDCLRRFVHWMDDGAYDFCTLPFSLKTQLSYVDQSSLQQIPFKWPGSMGELLDELQQMKDVLSHSEADICKTVVDMPLKSVIKYLEEIHTIDKEDRLPTLIPSTICLQHFVSLRLQLRRLVNTVQERLTHEQRGYTADSQPEHWPEFAAELWDRGDQLPHLRADPYSEYVEDSALQFAYDPQTGRYGFQDWSDVESETGMGPDTGGEPAWTHELSVEPSEEPESKEEEEEEEEGEEEEGRRREEEGGEATSREKVEDSFMVIPSDSEDEDEVRKKSSGYSPEDDGKPDFDQLLSNPDLLRMAVLKAQGMEKDTEAMEERARAYLVKDVANFLRNIGLDRYTTSFTEQGISGDLLLEADNEMLRELGVESPLDQLKILTLFRRRIMGQKSKHTVDSVQKFLDDHKLTKYSATFRSRRIDGDLLLEADESVLKELGVSSAIDRVKMRTKFKTFVAKK